MADDSQKTTAPQSNIDDLVKELSRTQPAPAQNPQPIKPAMPPSPAPTVPPRPTPAPVAPTPAPKPVAPTPPPSPVAPKEYQSSIRTMQDDLSKLKAGQQPQGTNIPRTVAPVTPASPTPAAPTRPSSTPVPPPRPTPPPVAPTQAPKPVTPTPPSALSVPPKPTPPPMPTVPPRPATPAVPLKPAPVAPGVSVPKLPEIKPEAKSPIVPTLPSTPSGSSRRSVILLALLVVVVIGAGLYWYFVIHGTSTQVAESPIETFTPRPTATPIQDPLPLAFPNQGSNITLPASGNKVSAFQSAINSQPNIAPGTLTAVAVLSGTASASQPLTFSGLLDQLGAQYPSSLTPALRSNSRVLIYGQKEAFDSKGKAITNPTLSHRLVLVSEVDSSALPVLQSWESSMDKNLSGVMNIDPAKNKLPFGSTTYQGIDIRFKNFAYPDHSIDYSIVPLGDKLYLVIAGSREAMFATIDAMQGVVPGK